MIYDVTHTTKYTYSVAVPVCHNRLHLEPRELEYQNCSEFRLLVHPEPTAIHRQMDYFGNHVSFFSIDQAHRGLTVTSQSRMEVWARSIKADSESPSWETTRDDLVAKRSAESLKAFQYTFPSSAIPRLPALAQYAAKSFPAGRPILAGAVDLTNRIFTEFTYDPTATTTHTPLSEVLEKRHGVCQDFAHFQIGCLRGLGLAARYVSGYLRTLPPPGKPRLVGADASHAWLSLFCGDEIGWVDLDPTNNVIPAADHLTVAWGRDYHDVCPIQGVIVGGGEHRMSVSVDVAPVSESPRTKSVDSP